MSIPTSFQQPQTVGLSKFSCALFSLLFAAVSVVAATQLVGDHDFYTRGEAREALVVQAIVDSGQLVLPLRAGVDLPSKPPLIHWLAAVFVWVGGNTTFTAVEFSIRATSAFLAAFGLSAFFTFLLFYLRRLWLPLVAALILGTSAGWLIASAHFRVDICFAVFHLLAVLSLATYLRSDKPSRFFFFASVLSLLAACLSKGPAGLLLPCAIVGLAELCSRTPSAAIKSGLKSLPPFLFAVVLSAGWYLAAYLQYGDAFLRLQLFEENLGRVFEVEGVNPGHRKNMLSLFAQLGVGFLPWIFLCTGFVAYLLRAISATGLRKATANVVKNLRRNAPGYPAILSFSALFVYTAVVFVSISRRPVYFLPAYPAIALLLALGVERIRISSLEENPVVFRYHRGAYTVCAVFCCLVSVAIAFGGALGKTILPPAAILESGTPARQWAETLLVEQGLLLSLLMLLLGVASWKFATLKTSGLLLLAASVYCSAVWVVREIMPLEAAIKSPKVFAGQLTELVPPSCPLSRYDADFYAVSYYAGRPVFELASLRSSAASEGEHPSPKRTAEPSYFLVKQRKAEAKLKLVDPESKVFSRIPALVSDNLAADGRDILEVYPPKNNSCGAIVTDFAGIMEEANPAL